MQETHSHDIQWFRHSAPYIHAHRGKTFVLMIPGDCISPDTLGNIIADISLLSSLGIRLVVVHGARNQIDHKLAGSDILVLELEAELAD